MDYSKVGVSPNSWDCPIWNTITPSDSVDLSYPARALYVEVAGNVKFTNVDGSTDVVPLDAHIVFIGKFQRVWATLTTATGIHAGY